MMTDEPMYEEWIANRREVKPSGDLPDRVMVALAQRDVSSQRYVRLANHINESRLARWAACLAASLIGSLPFLFAAIAAKLIVL